MGVQLDPFTTLTAMDNLCEPVVITSHKGEGVHITSPTTGVCRWFDHAPPWSVTTADDEGFCVVGKYYFRGAGYSEVNRLDIEAGTVISTTAPSYIGSGTVLDVNSDGQYLYVTSYDYTFGDYFALTILNLDLTLVSEGLVVTPRNYALDGGTVRVAASADRLMCVYDKNIVMLYKDGTYLSQSTNNWMAANFSQLHYMRGRFYLFNGVFSPPASGFETSQLVVLDNTGALVAQYDHQTGYYAGICETGTVTIGTDVVIFEEPITAPADLSSNPTVTTAYAVDVGQDTLLTSSDGATLYYPSVDYLPKATGVQILAAGNISPNESLLFSYTRDTGESSPPFRAVIRELSLTLDANGNATAETFTGGGQTIDLPQDLAPSGAAMDAALYAWWASYNDV